MTAPDRQDLDIEAILDDLYASETPALPWPVPICGFAVLHQPTVDSPQAAVRAAIAAENRKPSK